MQLAATAAAKPSYSRTAVARPGTISHAASSLKTSLHHDVFALQSEWLQFETRAAGTVFQTFEWLAAYQLHVASHRAETPCIAVVRRQDGTIAAIIPLAIRRAGIIRELTFFGSDLCDYNAPLLAPDFYVSGYDFKVLWRDILGQLAADSETPVDIVRLEKMPASIGDQNNPFVQDLQTSLNPSGSWATPLAGTWDEFYVAKRSGSTRSRDRSKRRRLEDSGTVTFNTPETAETSLRALDVLMEQKAAVFGARGIRNIFELPGYADFYRAVATDPRFNRIVHVSTLNVGSEAAAVNLGLMFAGRYYYVLSSYAGGALAKLGPGAIHLHELIRYAIGRGMTAFDFTIGDERYKRDWCDGVQPLYDHVSTATWRGVAMAAGVNATQRLKRTIKQNRTLWALFTALRSRLGRHRTGALS